MTSIEPTKGRTLVDPLFGEGVCPEPECAGEGLVVFGFTYALEEVVEEFVFDDEVARELNSLRV